jgi:phage shock protein E
MHQTNTNTAVVHSSTARALVRAGAQLLDVRSPAEFSESHLEGALNIPLPELARRLGELGPKHGTVVAYCRSGARSATASALLRANGFTQVHDLGAMANW